MKVPWNPNVIMPVMPGNELILVTGATGYVGGCLVPRRLNVGQEVDHYRVEALEPGRLLRLYSTLRAPGEGWLEWRAQLQTPETSWLTQTAFFAPRALPGFLYWFVLVPTHRFVFRGLIEALKRRSEAA